MTFHSLWILSFLMIIPVLIFLLIIESRRKKNALKLFAEPHLLSLLAETPQKGALFAKEFFFVLAVTFAIVAYAGPKWGSHYQEVHRKGVDIIFLLDVSLSMHAQDVKPDRLERAKREIFDFLKIAQGDRVGLVVFAGDAFVQCPLTLDYDAILMFLKSINIDTVPVLGTDMARGIKVSMDAFNSRSLTDKVIVMITDGEDNEKKGLEQAREAGEKGIKIFAYGIGDPGGAPVPDESGGFKKNKSGNLILSKLNEGDLEKIAEETGGRYVRSVTGDLDLDRLYFEGIKHKTEAKELEGGKIKVFEERFYIFLGFSLVCFLLEALIRLSRGNRRIFFILVIFFCLSQSTGFALESAEELYRRGEYHKAEQAFMKKDMKNPKDIRNRYNRGCASFMNSDYKGASAAFKSVLKRTDDKNISFRAAFNQGNSLYKLGDIKSAADSFKKAILLNPEDDDARYNYELAVKTLIENEKQKDNKKNNNNSQEQRDQDNKNKKKDDSKNKKNDSESSGSKNKEDKSTNKEKGANKKDNENHQDNREDNKGKGSDKNHEPEGNQEQKNDIPMGDSNRDNRLKPRDNGKAGGMSKNEAEAFLDNIVEDPSDINRFRFQGKKKRSASGKEW